MCNYKKGLKKIVILSRIVFFKFKLSPHWADHLLPIDYSMHFYV